MPLTFIMVWKILNKEHHFQHTFIKDHKDEEANSRVTSKANKRSSIGVRKSAKAANNSRTSHDHSAVKSHKEYSSYDLCKLQETVTGMLGVKRYEDWILNLNIGNVMHLSPLGLQEMNLQLDNSHELTRDAILEKIVLLSIAYFCVGTELRFLSQSRNKNKESQILRTNAVETEKYTKKESEKWQAKAVETSCTFLPSDWPLVGHVIASYQKHHSIISQSIPEDQELEEDLMFVHPLNEVKQDSINYHQIIKNHIPVEKPVPVYRLQQSSQQISSLKSSKYYDEIQELARSLGESLPQKPPKAVEEKPKRLKIYENSGVSRYYNPDKR